MGRIGSARSVENTYSTLDSCNDGFDFDGDFGTIVFDSIDVTDPGGNFNLAQIKSGSTVSDRLRISFSRVIVNSGQFGISASVGATIPIDGFQIFNNYFTGSGDFLIGIVASSDAAFFKENIGIRDTLAAGSMLIRGNTTATLLTKDEWVKVAGDTTGSIGPLFEKFTHSTNRLTYTGLKERIFKADVFASLQGGNNVNHTIAIFKNQQLVSASAFPLSTDGGGSFRNGTFGGIFTLNKNDFVEFYIRNDQNDSDATITNMNFIVVEM